MVFNRLHILGSGNAFFSDSRGHSSFLLSGYKNYLVDCGASSLLRMQDMQYSVSRQEGNNERISIPDIDAVLITHFHGDHIAGIPFLFLQYSIIENRKKPLQMIGPVGLQKKIEALMELLYPGLKISFPLQYRELLVHNQRTRPYLTVDEIEIQGFSQNHRPESLGYRIVADQQILAFSGDCSFDDSLFQLIDGVDLAVVELTMEKQPDKSISHVSLEEVQKNKSKLNARKIIFNHLYDDLAMQVEKLNSMNDQAVKRTWFQAAEDGMTLEL